MAIVIRYFSTASAGDGDGTTWANRAALFSSGDWSSIITGFDFSGTDSLECRIGPGTYACSQTLATGLFTNAPTTANNIFIHGCDASGDKLSPSNPDWVSAQPVDWDSPLPVIETTFNAATIFLTAHANLRLLKFTATGRNGGAVISARTVGWCVVINAASANNAEAVSFTISVANSALSATGTAYNVIMRDILQFTNNVRVEGNPDATSGNRQGVNFAGGNNPTVIRVTTLGNVGAGIVHTGTAGTSFLYLSNILAYNNGPAIEVKTTSQTTSPSEVKKSFLASNTHGVLMASGNTAMVVSDSRLRDNTTANFTGTGNFPTDFNNDTATVGADAAARDTAEFVNAAGGDFRIKATSIYWGKGIGAGDEIPTAAAIATAVWERAGRTLTS